MEDKIEIPRKEYLTLRKASAKLYFLEAGGVDNWEWYGESLYPEDGETYEDECQKIELEVNGFEIVEQKENL